MSDKLGMIIVIGTIVIGTAAVKMVSEPSKYFGSSPMPAKVAAAEECESLYTSIRGSCRAIADMDATEFRTRARATADLNEFCAKATGADKTICNILEDADYDGFKPNTRFNKESGLWN